MGFENRDYSRDPNGSYSTYNASHESYTGYRRQPPAFGRMRMWSVTTWIIVINVAVFLIDQIAGNSVHVIVPATDMSEAIGGRFPPLEWIGHFSAYFALLHLQLWRFITFQFLHANLEHLFFNMLSLFFFGPIIESYLGRRRYLAFYLLSGVAGALFYLVLWGFHILIGESYIPLVGASAGIFGVLIAAARVAPNARVLIYGILPMKLKTMAWLLLAIAIFTVFRNGNNAGGEAAHLGGAAMGFLLITQPRLLNVFEGRRRMRVWQA